MSAMFNMKHTHITQKQLAASTGLLSTEKKGRNTGVLYLGHHKDSSSLYA